MSCSRSGLGRWRISEGRNTPSPTSRRSPGRATMMLRVCAGRTIPIWRAGSMPLRSGLPSRLRWPRSPSSSQTGRPRLTSRRTASSDADATRAHNTSTARAGEDAMRIIALACAFVLSASSTSAQTVADFYRGKQIRVIVGSSPGDYDTWARVIVRHMRQHVPGNPTFVVENMPGAGSLIAANYLYSKAAQDGTVLGSVSRNIPNFAFMKSPNANFDPLKFSWIGSPEMTHRACFVRTDSGVTAPEHLFEREVLMGGDGVGTSLSEMPILLRNLLGMKFKVVDGYKGSTDIVLAMQRNEVHGLCQTVMAFAQAGQHLLDDGTVKMLFTTEKDRVAKY